MGPKRLATILLVREMSGAVALCGVVLIAQYLPVTVMGLAAEKGWTSALGFALWITGVVMSALFSIFRWGEPASGTAGEADVAQPSTGARQSPSPSPISKDGT